jgi:cytochrome c oxidase subunit 1
MLYGLAFIFLFSIGGLTGLYLGTLSTDIHFHDTYFVVAHFHYVMMGSALIGMFGGVHHWWPKMVGRHYNGTLARISWALIFVGFNVTFFTQFLLGSQGMPRRYYDYLPRYEIYHKISTVGSYMMAAGFLIMAFYLLQSIFGGRKSPANPWGANTLEWHCTSPPPHDNFATAPAIEDCYDYSGIDYDAKIGGYTSRANP